MAHPIIGVWFAEARLGGTFRVDQFTFAFHADGSLTLSALDLTHNGTWQATGPSTASMLAIRPAPRDHGAAGWFSMRGLVTVSADGMSCSIAASIKRPRPDGTSTVLDTTLTGNRLTVDSQL